MKEWLQSLSRTELAIVATDIKDVESAWPIAMPLCRAIADYSPLWEIRSEFHDGRSARTIFYVEDGKMILLHGFVKGLNESLETFPRKPQAHIELAQRWRLEVHSQETPERSRFDNFLAAEELLWACSTAAVERVLARKLVEEMERQDLTRLEIAERMQISSAQLDLLLDAQRTGVTLETMQRAAAIAGCHLQITLI